MRTRCLECEASTYRSETFTNIDIPLTFDANDCHVPGSDQEGSDSQNDVKDLFLKQILNNFKGAILITFMFQCFLLSPQLS